MQSVLRFVYQLAVNKKKDQDIATRKIRGEKSRCCPTLKSSMRRS